MRKSTLPKRPRPVCVGSGAWLGSFCICDGSGKLSVIHLGIIVGAILNSLLCDRHQMVHCNFLSQKRSQLSSAQASNRLIPCFTASSDQTAFKLWLFPWADDLGKCAALGHLLILTSRAQARGTNQREPRSGTGTAIPRCLQRFVSRHNFHHFFFSLPPASSSSLYLSGSLISMPAWRIAARTSG